MKKIGLIVLAVVLALGALGAGFAAWQSTLTINGTANAAKWDVHFNNAGANPSLTSGPNLVNEVIAGTQATLTTTGAPGTTITATINNCYPGLVATVYYDVSNSGTIPVNFNTFVSNSNLPTGTTVTGVPPAGPINGNGDTTEGSFTVTFPNSLTLNDMAPGSSYWFTVTFNAIQAP